MIFPQVRMVLNAYCIICKILFSWSFLSHRRVPVEFQVGGRGYLGQYYTNEAPLSDSIGYSRCYINF